MERICAAIRRSLQHGLAPPRGGAGLGQPLRPRGRGACTEPFVEMFANEDSLRMPADVRRALGVLLAQVAATGAGPAVPPLDIIEGTSRTAEHSSPA